ncbi:unnamed protein product [Prorocentrum cordatum]|uniref:Uncharacterized protein n=1 Tax=Prorocentrum cordatum TaxID=2364126 RepID=A0ABN9SLT9_9DINO|nr:unnamed protein product [Polarella glacialis]
MLMEPDQLPPEAPMSIGRRDVPDRVEAALQFCGPARARDVPDPRSTGRAVREALGDHCVPAAVALQEGPRLRRAWPSAEGAAAARGGQRRGGSAGGGRRKAGQRGSGAKAALALAAPSARLGAAVPPKRLGQARPARAPRRHSPAMRSVGGQGLEPGPSPPQGAERSPSRGRTADEAEAAAEATRAALRGELAAFASGALRQELEEVASKLRQHVHSEISEFVQVFSLWAGSGAGGAAPRPPGPGQQPAPHRRQGGGDAGGRGRRLCRRCDNGHRHALAEGAEDQDLAVEEAEAEAMVGGAGPAGAAAEAPSQRLPASSVPPRAGLPGAPALTRGFSKSGSGSATLREASGHEWTRRHMRGFKSPSGCHPDRPKGPAHGAVAAATDGPSPGGASPCARAAAGAPAARPPAGPGPAAREARPGAQLARPVAEQEPAAGEVRQPGAEAKTAARVVALWRRGWGAKRP